MAGIAGGTMTENDY
ncbi:hypothetical protein [Parabacteroides goldsteinii]